MGKNEVGNITFGEKKQWKIAKQHDKKCVTWVKSNNNYCRGHKCVWSELTWVEDFDPSEDIIKSRLVFSLVCRDAAGEQR